MTAASSSNNHSAFDEFVATIAALRAPDGCPWDREQTHESIAKNMIEEAYEAVDAIEANDVVHLREELGDVLLQVVLQSQIAADAGSFTIDEVCAEVNAKMIRRHPHVFGEAEAANANDVLDLWDKVKLSETNVSNEKSQAAGGLYEGLLEGVPTSFPALMQAQKISRKVASTGFEWNTLDEVWDKVYEEIAELKEAYAAAPKTANGKIDASAPGGSVSESPQGARGALSAVEQELGDVLFSLVNVGRQMGLDAESALRATCTKFRTRWSHMEHVAAAQGSHIESLAPDEREALWDEAKKLEK